MGGRSGSRIPFFAFDIWMVFLDKATDTVLFAEITLVVLPVMLVGDFLVQLQEGREEAITDIVLL